MPTMLAKHHDKFLERYLTNLESKNVVGKERSYIAKLKTNYITPILLTIKVSNLSRLLLNSMQLQLCRELK